MPGDGGVMQVTGLLAVHSGQRPKSRRACDARHSQLRANGVFSNLILLSYGGLDMTTVDSAHRFARSARSFERRYEASDGLVAVVLWSVGGLALTLLVIWLGSGAEFLGLG